MQDDEDDLRDQLLYLLGELEQTVERARYSLPQADREKAEARLIRLLAKLMIKRPDR